MNKLIDIWNYLQKTTQPIALYGMGNGAKSVIEQLRRIGKEAVGIFASEGFVRNQMFCGYKVTCYDLLSAQYPDMIILVCFGSNRREVLDYIAELSRRHTVLCPDVPVYGDNIFDLEFAHRHADEIQQVYDLLADDYSKETFQKIIEFKLTGLTEKLRLCQFEGGLFDLIEQSEQETYLDLGAYRGDTVAEFLQNAESYDQIYAFEPDPKTYAKLCQNVQSLRDVFPINMAVSNYTGTTRFFSAGRGSSMKKNGQLVSVCTLDSYFCDTNASLIKMDVEGQERETLLGAENLIKRCKPKMIVASYHRSEDIFVLPLLIHRMRTDYKIFLRHFPHNLAWDTNFYFI